MCDIIIYKVIDTFGSLSGFMHNINIKENTVFHYISITMKTLQPLLVKVTSYVHVIMFM